MTPLSFFCVSGAPMQTRSVPLRGLRRRSDRPSRHNLNWSDSKRRTLAWVVSQLAARGLLDVVDEARKRTLWNVGGGLSCNYSDASRHRRPDERLHVRAINTRVAGGRAVCDCYRRVAVVNTVSRSMCASRRREARSSDVAEQDVTLCSGRMSWPSSEGLCCEATKWSKAAVDSSFASRPR